MAALSALTACSQTSLDAGSPSTGTAPAQASPSAPAQASPSASPEAAPSASPDVSAPVATEPPSPDPTSPANDPDPAETPGTGDDQEGWEPEGGGDGPLVPAPLPTVEAGLDEVVVFDTGMDVEITGVEAIDVEAETPGEVSGPAVVVTVTARNTSTEPQSIDSAVVTLVASDGEFGIGTTAGGPSPFHGELEPGETAEASYVFMLDPARDRDITVTVNYAAGEPVAVFTGKTS